MSARTFIYGLLTATGTPLHTLVEGRVFAKKSMKSSVEEHPFLVYKLGNETWEELSEESLASRQFFQVWVHDFSDQAVADYMLIDEVIRALKQQLVNASSAADGVITIRFLEVSQDLNDETLNTVMKYVRFQAVLGEE